jgi:hypothetical protein
MNYVAVNILSGHFVCRRAREEEEENKGGNTGLTLL